MNIAYTISDIWQMTKRNLIRYKRSPKLIIFSTIQPIIFTLLFAFVFGGAISGSTEQYVQALIPGIIAQTVLFGATNTGVGLSEDLQRGIIDRFRSLPMSRGAVLAGRIFADSMRNLFVASVILTVGYIIGFRVQTSVLEAFGGLMVAVLLGIAIMWITACIGLALKDTETTQVFSVILAFPLTFAIISYRRLSRIIYKITDLDCGVIGNFHSLSNSSLSSKIITIYKKAFLQRLFLSLKILILTEFVFFEKMSDLCSCNTIKNHSFKKL